MSSQKSGAGGPQGGGGGGGETPKHRSPIPAGTKRERPDTQYFTNFPIPPQLNSQSQPATGGSPAGRESLSVQGKRPPPPVPTNQKGGMNASDPSQAHKLHQHRSEPYLSQPQHTDVHQRPFSTPDLSISTELTSPPAPKKKLSMREEVFNELICTERIYNRHLNVIVDVLFISNTLSLSLSLSHTHTHTYFSPSSPQSWMAKLKHSGFLEPNDISTIFSNVEQIRNLNRELMTSLDELVDLPLEQQNVGERFLSFVSISFSHPK